MLQAAPELPFSQMQMGAYDEYDAVNKLTDEIEQQMIDFPQDEASEAADMNGSGPDTPLLTPPLNHAYPSAAIRKPRSFYNYFGEDTIPLLDTDPDEILYRFSGGDASTEHELFIPFHLTSDNAAAASPSASFLNPKP
ncbi:hypothetical protein, conserved [Eimeria praecox]|uniref:Uncharacterized protein n=1 Tax=Eimeria praecox TaxID=51316 RepID=U6G6Q0_9EIME|nr:hypothetical protein, conserved [Eimeria praecox]